MKPIFTLLLLCVLFSHKLAAGLYQIMVEQGGVILTKQKVVMRR